VKIYKIR